MKLRRIVVSDFQTNCYIYYDEKNAFIIDPGANVNGIRTFIHNQNLNPLCIFLTHGHIDHIGAAEVLANQYGIDLYIHQEDEKYLRDPAFNLSAMFGTAYSIKAPVKYYEKEMNIDGHQIIIHHTPGHTPGSVMIEFVEEKIIFSGDMLFAGSIGRYDFPGSSWTDMKKSIDYIKSIRYECHVLPGHGNQTTLQSEIVRNPFFNGGF